MKNIIRIVFIVLFYLGFSPVYIFAQTAHLQSGFSMGKSMHGNSFNAKSTDSVQNSFAIKTNPLLIVTERFQVQFDIPVFKTGFAIYSMEVHGLNKVQPDVSNIESGLYQVRTTTADNSVLVKSFVKTN